MDVILFAVNHVIFMFLFVWLWAENIKLRNKLNRLVERQRELSRREANTFHILGELIKDLSIGSKIQKSQFWRLRNENQN